MIVYSKPVAVVLSNLATAQDGSLRQAGGPDTSLNAAAAMGRWVAAISAVTRRISSAELIERHRPALSS